MLDKGDATIEKLQIVEYGINKYEASEVSENNNPFQTLNDLMLVHKTNYLPTNDTIHTSKSTHAQQTIEFEFKGEKYMTSCSISNNTTHFALNGPVSSHMYGNWDDCKYAILTSLENVDRSNLIGVRPEDTYFDGNVSLGENYYILMPEKEVQNNGFNANPHATIVSYDGLSIDEAVSSFLAYIGKMPEGISNNDWLSEDFKFVEPVLDKNNIPIAPVHFDSKYMTERRFEKGANQIIAVFEALKKNGINPTEEEMYEVIKNNDLGYIGQKGIDGENELFEQYYFPIFKNHGYNIYPEKIFEDEKLKLSHLERGEDKIDIINRYVFSALINNKTSLIERDKLEDEQIKRDLDETIENETIGDINAGINEIKDGILDKCTKDVEKEGK